MSKIHFTIPYPTFIESIGVHFLLRYRKKKYGYPFREIKLSNGMFTRVDSDDYLKLAIYDWISLETKNKKYYVARYAGRKLILMHRVIMNAPKGSVVDHKDRDSLNNTKRNLQFATHSQNNCNRMNGRKNKISKFKGIRKCKNKWEAYIGFNCKRLYLGRFDNEEDAARAYDEAAKKYHGEFAVLNFPQNESQNQNCLAPTRSLPSRMRGVGVRFLKYHLLNPAPLNIKINKERCGVDVKILCCIILLVCIFTKMTAETDMIKINELRKRFGPIVAVDGVSFEVQKGQVLGFLGPNGAGKSTVMRMLACFLRPDGGTAQICGFDILKNPIEVRRNIGYLAENVPAYNEMTVGAFLNFVCDVRELTGQKRKQALDKVVSMCHIESVYHQSIETLSKGYKRRAGLAQALLHDPPVLILDEPTDGLDPNQKFEVRHLISKMAQDKCIVVSTHILDEVEAICDRAIIIARGKILADSTPAELKDKYHGTLDEVFRKITLHKVVA